MHGKPREFKTSISEHKLDPHCMFKNKVVDSFLCNWSEKFSRATLLLTSSFSCPLPFSACHALLIMFPPTPRGLQHGSHGKHTHTLYLRSLPVSSQLPRANGGQKSLSYPFVPEECWIMNCNWKNAGPLQNNSPVLLSHLIGWGGGRDLNGAGTAYEPSHTAVWKSRQICVNRVEISGKFRD